MRTKTLLAACAALAFSLATSQAQVYSANVVGYVNVTLQPGYNMICNPLDADGTGTNNTLQTVFGTQLASGSTVYAFANGGYVSPAAVFSHGAWGGGTNAANAALSVGKGVFVLNAGSAVTLPIVGQVMQGSLANSYNNGYNIISYQVPIPGLITTGSGYPAASGDTAYIWDPVAQAYINPASVFSHGAWSSQPNLAVGQAVMLLSASPSGGVWNTNFTVQ